MFCCTRPPLSGILSLCKTQKQLCALENDTQASIGTGVSNGWRNYPFTNSLYCSFRGAGNSILILTFAFQPVPVDSSRWGSSRRARWVGGGPQLREEEAGARTDADLAGLSLLHCLFYWLFFTLSHIFCVPVTQVCSARSSSLLSPQDVQLKVKAYILGTDMSNFKYDDFIVVLDVISRYAAGGDSPASSPLSLLIGCHRPRSCCPPPQTVLEHLFLKWNLFRLISFPVTVFSFYIHFLYSPTACVCSFLSTVA